MAFDFPNTPSVGNVANGYTWDGEKWAFTPNPIIATPSNVNPFVDGTANPGVLNTYSRGDHIHPSDPSKLSKTANLSDVENVVNSRKSLYAAPFDAMAYSGMQVNGGFDVSQEKGTATSASGYICDGWRFDKTGTFVAACGVTASGNSVWVPGNMLYGTISTAQASLGAGDYTSIAHSIEGYRIARLQWGTANAQSITIAFWSNHIRVGLYTGTVRNSANTRSYAFSYTHAASNIAQYNVFTIPGCTDGVWDFTNGAGMSITLSVGCGATATASSNNSWLPGNYIAGTGQINAVAATTDAFRFGCFTVLPGIEAPSAARSPLIMRPYDQELVTCRRYFRSYGGGNVYEAVAHGQCFNAFGASVLLTLDPPMRGAPTAGFSGAFGLHDAVTSVVGITSVGTATITPISCMLNLNVAGGLVAGNATKLLTNNDINARFKVDARL